MWLKIRLKPSVELIDGATGKHVGLRQRHVASVVEEGHGAGKSALLCESRRTSRLECGLPGHN